MSVPEGRTNEESCAHVPLRLRPFSNPRGVTRPFQRETTTRTALKESPGITNVPERNRNVRISRSFIIINIHNNYYLTLIIRLKLTITIIDNLYTILYFLHCNPQNTTILKLMYIIFI